MKRLNHASALALTLTLTLTLVGCGNNGGEDAPAVADPDQVTEPGCDELTIAVADDDVHRAMFYAHTEGLVEGEAVAELKVDFLPIPSLVEAANAGTYDLVEGPSQAPAILRPRGVDSRVLGPSLISRQNFVIVAAESEIDSLADAEGRTIGVVALGATPVYVLQTALVANDLNPDTAGGDVNWAEVPFEQMLTEIGRSIDYGTLGHYALWLAQKDDRLRLINYSEDYTEATGGQDIVTSVFLTTGDKLEGRGPCFQQAQQTLDEIFSYAVENHEEVASAIAAQSAAQDQADVEEFLNVWLTEWYRFDPTGDEESLGPVLAFWEQLAAAGLTEAVPTFEEVRIVGDE